MTKVDELWSWNNKKRGRRKTWFLYGRGYCYQRCNIAHSEYLAITYTNDLEIQRLIQLYTVWRQCIVNFYVAQSWIVPSDRMETDETFWQRLSIHTIVPMLMNVLLRCSTQFLFPFATWRRAILWLRTFYRGTFYELNEARSRGERLFEIEIDLYWNFWI